MNAHSPPTTPSRATFAEVAGFVQEARSYLPTVREQLRLYEADPRRPEPLAAAYRYVQTLGGAASMFGLRSLSRLLGELEDILRPAYEGASGLSAGSRDRSRRVLDDLELALAGFRLQAERAGSAHAATLAEEDAELAEIFRLEAEDHFLELARLFARLRAQPEDREALREVQRRAHSLKGAAGTAGLAGVSALAHRMEDLLDAVLTDQPGDGRPGARLEPGGEVLRTILRTTDAIQSLVHRDVAPDGLEETLRDLGDAYADLLGEEAGASLTRLDLGPAAPVAAEAAPPPHDPEYREHGPPPAGAPAATGTPAADQPMIRLPLDRYDRLQRLAGELIINRGALEQQTRRLATEIEECEAGVARLERISAWLEDAAESPGTATAASLAKPPIIASPPVPDGMEADLAFDALEFDRYTEAHTMARQLTEAAADLNAVAADLRAILRATEVAVGRERRLSGELEDRLTRGRLVPFSTLLPRLERAVRVTAERRDRTVELSVEGQDTALDKLILEELTDPLLHMIRNAVTHGIEPAHERRGRGKPAAGRVRVRVTAHGRQVRIEISDDGRGLDTAAIRRVAAERGLASPERLAGLPVEELHRWIFQPGFTTAPSVDEMAGRGIGMDVVESTVRRLNGDVRVSSREGSGTVFTLRLPLSLATDRVLLARAGRRVHAIPQAYVESVVEVTPEMIEAPAAGSGEESGEILRLGERRLLLVRLAELAGAAHAAPELPGRRLALLIERSGSPLALLVDAVLGSREVVIKPLGAHLERLRGVVGATILGDGQLVLILNPGDLALDARPRAVQPLAAAAPSLSILVVDDSLSIRRAVSRSMGHAGWRAIEARDGQEALELLQELDTRPDAMIADVEMPRMDGYELVATLRGLEQWADLPIIMLTSRAGEKHRRRAFEVGANDYVVKPYQEGTLVRTIKRLTSPNP